jgi:multidrug transporter EmrE-like cation transporter
VLLLLFLVAGAADTALKVFDEHFASYASRATYLLLAFGGAFGAGLTWMLASPRRLSMRLSPRTCVGGIVLGVINYGSAEFFLRALEELPGTLAYPVNHVAVLLGGTLLGVVIWRESLSRLNRWGLALAAASLVLLTV